MKSQHWMTATVLSEITSSTAKWNTHLHFMCLISTHPIPWTFSGFSKECSFSETKNHRKDLLPPLVHSCSHLSQDSAVLSEEPCQWQKAGPQMGGEPEINHTQCTFFLHFLAAINYVWLINHMLWRVREDLSFRVWLWRKGASNNMLQLLVTLPGTFCKGLAGIFTVEVKESIFLLSHIQEGEQVINRILHGGSMWVIILAEVDISISP